MRMGKTHRSGPRGAAWQWVSPGAWIILALAAVSGVLILLRPGRYEDHELEFWAFADTHVAMYGPLLRDEWNPAHQPIPGVPGSGSRVKLLQVSITAEQQRLMSGFYADTPIADVMEIERGKVGGLFGLPVDKIGLYDLTERLKAEHLYEQFNAPSFSPWTTRGHVFGIPHDVHPVMLCYRSDIVEAAGIDVRQIETWDDYVRVMSPLMQERDAEGKPRHYLLNLWPTEGDQMEILLLQNGGSYFDADGAPNINSPQNVRTLSQIVLWCTGPTQIAAECDEFDGAYNKLRVDGYVIGSLMPDWLTGTWRHDIPQLAGKVKLMPLPAWDKGGRRTSIWGGTMLAISKNTRNFEKAWTFAKELYMSPKIATQLYEQVGIVSPVKKMWTDPIYDQPVAYLRAAAGAAIPEPGAGGAAADVLSVPQRCPVDAAECRAGPEGLCGEEPHHHGGGAA